ncbi:MAG: serine hydrolase domain-containing protein [Anaerolineales bacterium]|jgi:CubicO group peptidase (beta-lactamase class C family)
MTIENESLSLPIEFSAKEDSAHLGISESGRQRIKQVFDDQIDRGLHPGAQIVVLRWGHVILDFSEGFTSKNNKVPISPDTQFLVFSLTKPFTSCCVFKLIEEDKIHLDDPVGLYWPEFSCLGKEEITIKQVLLHQTGLPRNGLVYQILNIRNWKKVTDNLTKQSPIFLPGTKTAYQLLNYGFILGEIVYRVTGLPIDEYLRREFLAPLGLLHTTMRVNDFQNEEFAHLSSATPDHQVVAWIFNSSRVRGALIPAASLHSTARDIAVFFQMLLNQGKYAGQRFLASRTVELMTSLGHEDFDQSLGRKTRWGYGFFLGGDHQLHPEYADGMGKGSTLQTFGHYGQRNSMVWADKESGLVVVYLCNRFLSSDDNKARLQQISDAVWDAIEQ